MLACRPKLLKSPFMFTPGLSVVVSLFSFISCLVVLLLALYPTTVLRSTMATTEAIANGKTEHEILTAGYVQFLNIPLTTHHPIHPYAHRAAGPLGYAPTLGAVFCTPENSYHNASIRQCFSAVHDMGGVIFLYNPALALSLPRSRDCAALAPPKLPSGWTIDGVYPRYTGIVKFLRVSYDNVREEAEAVFDAGGLQYTMRRHSSRASAVLLRASAVGCLASLGVLVNVMLRVAHLARQHGEQLASTVLDGIHEIMKVPGCDSEALFIAIEQMKCIMPNCAALAAGAAALSLHSSRPVVAAALTQAPATALALAQRSAVVLFVDIKDFTTISETIPPHLLSRMLDEYFDACAGAIYEAGGEVDKYIGDCVMGIWVVSAPKLLRAAADAAWAALEMRRRLARRATLFAEMGVSDLVCRVGVHAGECLIGMAGCRARQSFTALGDVVNLASRLEEANKAYGTYVLVTSAIADEIKDKNVIKRPMGALLVKGKSQQVNVVALYDGVATTLGESRAQCEKLCEIHTRALAAYEHGIFRLSVDLCTEYLRTLPADKATLRLLESAELGELALSRNSMLI